MTKLLNWFKYGDAEAYYLRVPPCMIDVILVV